MAGQAVFSNREAIKAAEICGCASCLRIFPARLVGAWTDHGQTALCPYCSIDALVPVASGEALNANDLFAIHREAFGLPGGTYPPNGVMAQ